MLYATTGGPTLQPMFLYACPNQSVIFTCSDNKVTIIEWRVEPYTIGDDELSFTSSQIMDDPGPLTVHSLLNFYTSVGLMTGLLA